MVTLGKHGTLHDRRLAAARLHQEDAVKCCSTKSRQPRKIVMAVTPESFASTNARRCRGQRAILEWVDMPIVDSDRDCRRDGKERRDEVEEKTAEAAK